MSGYTSFAIVPAAGHSRRMGTAKLLLPWRGRPLIDHLLSAWQRSHVSRVIVVVRADDKGLRRHLCNADVDLVVPSPAPLEMKDSVASALTHLRQAYAPQPEDVWLLAPADLPRLDTQLINQVLLTGRTHPEAITVPVCAGRRGHPVSFGWSMHSAVFQLRPDEGVNALLQQFPVREVEVDSISWQDVDDPQDFQRLDDSPAERDPGDSGGKP